MFGNIEIRERQLMTKKQQQDVVGVAKWVAGMLIAVLVAWTAVKVTVAENCVRIDSNQKALLSLDKRIKVVEDCAVGQAIHNQWMKETLTRIDKKMD